MPFYQRIGLCENAITSSECKLFRSSLRNGLKGMEVVRCVAQNVSRERQGGDARSKKREQREVKESIYPTFILPFWYRSRGCFTVFLVLLAVEDVFP